jgi:hypothetical protein
MKPFFKHDCTKCVFIGQAEIQSIDHKSKGDIYYCGTTLVYRHSDEPSDYGSIPISLIKSHLSMWASLAFSLYLKYIGVNGSSNDAKTAYFIDGNMVDIHEKYLE